MMAYDLADVLAALKTAYEGVTGMGAVLSYVPKSFQHLPTMVTEHAGTTWRQMGMGGAARKATYSLTSTLWVLWQDNEPATDDIIDFVDAIPAAVHADMTLGGVLDDGSNCIVEDCAPVEWVEVNSVLYAKLVFSVRVGPMQVEL